MLATDFLLEDHALGVTAADLHSNIHLFQYLAMSDGKEGDQILRTCASFHMGTGTTASFHVGWMRASFREK